MIDNRNEKPCIITPGRDSSAHTVGSSPPLRASSTVGNSAHVYMYQGDTDYG